MKNILPVILVCRTLHHPTLVALHAVLIESTNPNNIATPSIISNANEYQVSIVTEFIAFGDLSNFLKSAAVPLTPLRRLKLGSSHSPSFASLPFIFCCYFVSAPNRVCRGRARLSWPGIPPSLLLAFSLLKSVLTALCSNPPSSCGDSHGGFRLSGG